MMRNHRPHVGHVVHRRLAAHEPQGHREHDHAAADDANVDAPILVHPEHERQHDDGHRRTHHQGHVGSCLAEVHVVELVGVQVHQAEHDDR